MNGEPANTSENHVQDTKQMRSEGKGPGSQASGSGRLFACVCARMCVCTLRVNVTTWHGEYERCQTSLSSSFAGVN